MMFHDGDNKINIPIMNRIFHQKALLQNTCLGHSDYLTVSYEIISHWAIIYRSCNSNEIGILVNRSAFKCVRQIKKLLCPILFNILIFIGNLRFIYQLNFLGNYINCSNVVLLRKKCSNTRPHKADTYNRNIVIYIVHQHISFKYGII